MRHSLDSHRARPLARLWPLVAGLTVLLTSGARGSDHADPMDLFNLVPLEGGITDLFAFPVDADDKPVEPWPRGENLPLHDPLANIVRPLLKDDQVEKIDAIVFILCVRRALTDKGTLNLEPYTYRIHLDFNSTIEIPDEKDLKADKERMQRALSGGTGYGTSPVANERYQMSLVEAYARYGGRIPNPSEIGEEVRIVFQLNNNAELKGGTPTFERRDPRSKEWAAYTLWANGQIVPDSGVYDDPFIFPAFFGTDVVAMAVRVPIALFPSPKSDMLVWATSERAGQPVDHVGRSLRTQNPRFELLNPLHPSKHVQAIIDEDNNPGLLRDVGLRLNLPQLAAYRGWDRVPDVMCFSTRYPVGYPNGRLLTDDVAAILAQHGDTLLYELSYQHPRGSWPRRTANDVNGGVFRPKFPYLLPPQKASAGPPPLRLSNASVWKLIGIALVLLALLVLENWIVAWLYYRYKIRKRYL